MRTTGEGAEEEAAPQAAEVVPEALEVLYEPVRQHPPGEDELCEVRLSESETTAPSSAEGREAEGKLAGGMSDAPNPSLVGDASTAEKARIG